MKRCISIFCALGMMFSASAALASGPGDCNDDGVVDQADVAIARDALNTAVGDDYYVAAADIDGNGTISSSDLIAIVNLAGQ